MAATTLDLSEGWTFRQTTRSSDGEWLTVESLPTEVHLDLHKNGKIADPFLDLNELSVRWVAEQSWTYRRIFQLSQKDDKSNIHTDLVFKGLDTFATVILNGKTVLTTDNMFVEYRLSLDNVASILNSEGDNVLEIIFDSARHRGLDLVKQHPEHRFIVHQTEVSRGPVRKAQYHWGWDWGPILITCGPWKPILLQSYVTRIEDSWIHYELDEDLKKARISLHATCSGQEPAQVEFRLLDGHKLVHSSVIQSSTSSCSAQFLLDNPKLWWPHGYGPQNRYQFEVRAVAKDQTILDQKSKFVGFRQTQLVQEADKYGKSFYFRVNNTDIFSGGSCWIPADNLVSRVSPQTYKDWIRLMADGNQIMIRVWGGGFYETDSFYDACDEFGVLVWQDFAFACASYPTYPEYLKSIEEEARQNVRRLRHHPSLIIWAGNNEDYQIVERYGLEYNFDGDKDPQSWLKSSFPARYIYEHLLPNIIMEETTGTIYHPSSPWGDGKSTVLKVDSTVGDVHQWNVWHGEMKPYQQLPVMGGRFVSEFGMEAYPHIETIEAFVTDPAQRYPGSMTMDFHNKAINHERRLVSYIAENFQIKYDLPSFIHLSQMAQAETMTWAYKSWRRKWGTPGARECSGVLVWQLNDSWPTMSWAIVDYFLVKKPAYYAIKRALSPIAVGVCRKVHDWTVRPADPLWQRDTAHVDPTKAFKDVSFDVWVASSRPESFQGEIIVKFISIRTGKEIQESIKQGVSITPNSTTEVILDGKLVPKSIQDDKKPFNTKEMDPFVIYVSLSIDGNETSTDCSWPDPIKYLDFNDRGIQLSPSGDGQSVTITASKPVKGFVFSEKRGIRLSDNGFDLMPGVSKQVSTEGIKAEDLQWTYVGH